MWTRRRRRRRRRRHEMRLVAHAGLLTFLPPRYRITEKTWATNACNLQVVHYVFKVSSELPQNSLGSKNVWFGYEHMQIKIVYSLILFIF
jgi:hypothetical protein